MSARLPSARHAAGVALAALLLHACGTGEPASDAPLRLLADGVPATLGRETRLSTGARATLLFRKVFEAGAQLPRAVRLPDAVASSDRVLLHYQAWQTTQAGLTRTRALEHSVVVRVQHTGERARARLAQLGRVAPGPPVTLAVSALPLPRTPRDVRHYNVAVPRDAALHFAIGIREESWLGDAAPVQFEVARIDAASERQILFRRSLDPARESDRGWFDARVSLAEHAGETITLELATGPAAESDAMVTPAAARPTALGVFGDPVIVPQRASDARPNLLLVSLDTLRARNLAAYGYARETSPFLDSLARAGTLFEDAIATSVTTGPSHMSLFTGLYPPRHGVRRGLEPKRAGVLTLAERLRAAGYHTAAFTENGYLVREHGFGDGFSEYTENRGEQAKPPGQVDLTFGQAGAWLTRQRAQPFFLFVHTYQVHAPYDPPAALAQRFAAVDVGGERDAAAQRQLDAYDAEIRQADDALRGLLAALEAAGQAESTLVVIVSDHGEEFREHGGLQHGATVFDEQLRVPLLLFGPGRIPAGIRHRGQVSLVDLAPTLLELLGVAAPEALDGVSLAPLLRGGAAPPPRPVFAEAYAARRWMGPWLSEPAAPPLFAVRTQTAKFVVHRPERGAARPPLRFDLAADPDERQPLALDAAEQELADALLDAYLAGERAEPGDADPDSAPGVAPDLAERLRLLGYLGEEGSADSAASRQ